MNVIFPVLGAVVGGFVGGPRGAVVGGSIGLGIGLLGGSKEGGGATGVSSAPLRDRALARSIAEFTRWGGQAPSVEQIDQYLEGVEPHGAALAAANSTGSIVNFCAAAIGWSEHEAAQRGDTLPPWRSGARQLMYDSQAGLRGPWHPASELASGWLPPSGSVVVYTRGDPAAGMGHCTRTTGKFEEGKYQAVGANETERRWSVSMRAFDSPSLLGFVVDGEPPRQEISFAQYYAESAVDFVEPPLTSEQLRVINGT